jgi:hypothetical protein
VVVSNNKGRNENFFALKVRLLSDFSTLNNVQVVLNNASEELRRLEEMNQVTEGKQTPETEN